MNLNTLISRPNQAKNHELAEMESKVPKNKNARNTKLKFFKNIKKKEIKTLI
jgi:hypothetical protein